MTITLTPANYAENREEIAACLNGNMCKIMKINDHGKTVYFICADITGGGWTTRSGRAFHCHSIDPYTGVVQTGLGTFYMISATKTDDGGCILKFTDDLNPELP